MHAEEFRSDGPDFICIGMQKAATGWLYDQLHGHTGFWMPPIKELHYFDRPYPDLGNAGKVARLKRRAARRGDPDDKGSAFLGAAFEAFTEPTARTPYAAMFGPAGNLLTGDVTPGYSTLPPTKIAMLANWFPQVKIVLLVRDPVERFWSALCMLWRRGEFDRQALDDAGQLRAFLALPRVAKRSFPTTIAERWRDAFGGERFRVFFFDDIAADPTAARAGILSYLAPAQGEANVAAEANAKAGKLKLELTSSTRAVLAEMFAEELVRCRAMFGGPAIAWCERYGL